MSTQPHRQRESLISGRLFFILTGSFILAGMAIIAISITKWRSGQEQTTAERADSRPAFNSPYRNTSPEVQYVGDEVCARCHAKMAESYRKHPMSRSLGPVASMEPLERYDSSAHNPFDSQGLHYQVDRQGQRVYHKETHLNPSGKVLMESKAEVQFALGSGTHGRSYLVNHDGYVFQSPISWFAQANRWDLAPGYQITNQHFSRPIGHECLTCHANRAKSIPDTINRFHPPIFQGFTIGCERCHGPGEIHVRNRKSSHQPEALVRDFDDTIVNPADLEPALREAVCQQCHLQGDFHTLARGRQLADFRPGLPLNQFISIYVRSAGQSEQKMAVGQVEQMYASQCFQKSGRKLGCTSCHDPHDYPDHAEKIDYYHRRCMECHQEIGCKMEESVRRMKSPKDNCIDCHMPRFPTADVAHAAATDHQIPRFPGKVRPPTPVSNPKWVKFPIHLFPEELMDAPDIETDRDLGIALAELAGQSRVLRSATLALELLEPALERWPDDVPAWEAKGYALMILNQPRDALEAYKKALTLKPEREISLIRAAVLSGKLHENDAAIGYWKKAIEVNPWNWQFFKSLAFVLVEDKEWKAAVEQCQKALVLNPNSLETRQLLVACYLRLGDQEQAKSEFEVLAALSPEPESMRRWFEQQLR